MKRYLKNVVASLLLIVFVLSSYVPTFAVGTQPSSYSSKYNSGERDVVCTTLDGTSADAYYTGSYEFDVLSEKSGTEIFNSLRNLMRTTHTYTSSYDDCHYKADKTDCENENGKISLIYTGYEATQSQWNGWNREHVWPKSLGGNNTTGGGADMHHIRPSDAVVNSTRGNKKYGYADGGKATYGSNPASGYLGGYAGTYFEPLDNVKGDVARICLYVYVRWGSAWGADSITEVFQSVGVLLEWCALDPVDTWEMGRNEVVESYQGNRNVFIDYPEYAWLIFDRDVPDNLVSPSGNAGTDSGNQGSGTPGETTCKHVNIETLNYAHAECFKDGYTGDTYCNDCDTIIEYGSVVPSDNKHSNGKWTLSSDGVTYERKCSVCGEVQIMTVDSIVVDIDDDAKKILLMLSLGVIDSSLLEAISN